MPKVRILKPQFLDDSQGKTFADIVNDPSQPFDVVFNFFDDARRQQRMEEAEIHHDRAPLAGVIRELESLPEINDFLASTRNRRNARFKQAVGVLVRIIMERRGWKKTGRKGSLGVRAAKAARTPTHNSGGLAFWFLRAERYVLVDGMPYQSVRQRRERLDAEGDALPANGSLAQNL